MMIHGNFSQNNWYMGNGKVDIKTLRDFLEQIEDFSTTFRLEDGNGNTLTLRMGDKAAGVLIIETNVLPSFTPYETKGKYE